MQEDASAAAPEADDPSGDTSFPRRLGDLELVTALDPEPPLQVLGGHLEERPCLVYLQTAAAAGSADALAAYRRGAQQALLIQHPGFARVIWVEPDGDEAVHVAVEHVEAPFLTDLISVKERLSARRAMRLIWSLCRAVGAAHRAGLVHGHLFPQMILVPSSREPRIVGLHRRRGTGAGLEVPADAFSAPEIHSRPDQSPSPPADVYSLGALLVYTLTGSGPDPKVSLCSRRPEIHPDLETICNKALHHDPLKRYPSADAFAADLAALRDGEAPRAAIRAARSSMPAPRNTLFWVGGALLLAAGLTIGALGSRMFTEHAPEADNPAVAELDHDRIAKELGLLKAAAASVIGSSQRSVELLAQLPDRQETAAARASLLLSLARARLAEASTGQPNLPEVRLLGQAFCLDPEGTAGLAAFELLAEAALLARHDLTARRMFAHLARWLPAGQKAGALARLRLIQLELRAGELTSALSRLETSTEVVPEARAVLPGRPDLVAQGRLSQLIPLLTALGDDQPLLGGAPATAFCSWFESGQPASLLAWQGSALTRRSPNAEISRLQLFDPAEVPIAMAVADLGATGQRELIAVTQHRETREARLSIISLDSPGRPALISRGLGAHVVPGLLSLGDLDGNGLDDLIVGNGQPMGGCQVFLFHSKSAAATGWRVDERVLSLADPVNALVCVAATASSDQLLVSTTGSSSQVQVFSLEPSTGLFAARRLKDSSGVEALAASAAGGAPGVIMARGSDSTAGKPGDVTLVSLTEGAPRSRWPLPQGLARVETLSIGRPKGRAGPAIAALTGQAGDGTPLTYLQGLHLDNQIGLWLPGAGPCLFADLQGKGMEALVLGSPARILGASKPLVPRPELNINVAWPRDGHHRRLAAASALEACGQVEAALSAYANLAALSKVEAVVQRDAWLGETRCHLTLGDHSMAEAVVTKVLRQYPAAEAQVCLVRAAIAEERGLEDAAREFRLQAWRLDGLAQPAKAPSPALFARDSVCAAPLIHESWQVGAASLPWQTESAFRFRQQRPGELEVHAPSLLPTTSPPGPTWPAALFVPTNLDGGPVALDMEWLGKTDGLPPRVLIGLFEGDDSGLVMQRLSYGETRAALAAIDIRPIAQSISAQPRVRISLKILGVDERVVASFAANERFTASLTIDPLLQQARLAALPTTGGRRQQIVAGLPPGRGPALFGIVSQASLPELAPLVPGNMTTPGVVRLGSISLRVPPTSSSSLLPARQPASTLARQALGALSLGQARRTRVLADQALALEPDQHLARLARSLTRGQDAEAAADAGWALLKAPAKVLPLLLAARRHLNQELPQAALVEAGRLLDADPPTRLESAKSLLLAGEPARALILTYRSATSPNTESDRALQRAYALQLLGDHKQALLVVHSALSSKPKDPLALASRALSLLHLGQAQQAKKDLDQAIAASTSPRGEWYLLRGRCLAALGKIKRALRDLDHAATKLGPRQPRSLSLWRKQLQRQLTAPR